VAILVSGGRLRRTAPTVQCGRVGLGANRQGADRTDELSARCNRGSSTAHLEPVRDGILSKIDPQTGKVVASANTAAVPVVSAGEGLWVSDAARRPPTVDPDDGCRRPPNAAGPCRAADATQSVVVGAGSVWVGRHRQSELRSRLIRERSGAVSYAILAGELSAGFWRRRSAGRGGVIGRLSRIDPVTTSDPPARDWANGCRRRAALLGSSQPGDRVEADEHGEW
jgi:hypothetical protein